MKQVSAFITYASLGVGIVFAALLVLFMQPILGIFGANAETYDLAKDMSSTFPTAHRSSSGPQPQASWSAPKVRAARR